MMVDYRIEGAGWVLSVIDDGVGLPAAGAKPGLGTTVVRALAQQLGAEMAIADAGPGARIALTHLATVAA
jgi:two-component sensor histidine kinase